MSDTDPHIHVDRKAVQAAAGFRNVVVSLLGRVPESPSVVTTGCGIDVPRAMTSPHPESVTCLACREHARLEHLEYAEMVERLSRLSRMPGAPITADQAAEAARWARDRARRFT